MRSLGCLYFFLGLALAYFAKAVFIPLFLAVFSAILLEPIIARLAHRNISRHLATILIIVIFVVISAGALWLGYISFANLAGGISSFKSKLGLASAWFQAHMERFDLSYSSNLLLKSTAVPIQKVQIVETYPSWTGYLINGAGSLFQVIAIAIFVPLLLFYFLYDKENLVESFNAVIGKYCYLPKLNYELPKMIRTFIMGNILTVLILLFCHGIVLYFLGFNNWIPLTVISAVVAMIPIVGLPISILLPITQGLSGPESLFPYVTMIVSFLVFQLIANNLILPQLIGSKINVNTAALLFGLLFWGWLWGAMGFILAVPMTALVKIILESNPETVPLANLLAAKPRHILPGSNYKHRDRGSEHHKNS